MVVENEKLVDQWLGIAVAATGMQRYDEDDQDWRQDIEIPWFEIRIHAAIGHH